MTQESMHGKAPSNSAQLTLILNGILHIISAVLFGGWLLAMLPDNLFMVVLLVIAMAVVQISLSVYALRSINSLEGQQRRKTIFVIGAMMLPISLTAGTAASSVIGLSSGEAAFQQRAIVTMIGEAEGDKNAIAQINALIPTFDGCTTTFKSMEAFELATGAVSLEGGRSGPVTNELTSIVVACTKAQQALLASRAVSSDVFSDMDRIIARARRVNDDKALSDIDKDKHLVRMSEELAALHKALGAAMPITALRSVRDNLNKDRSAVGLSAPAVATIAAAVLPISKAIGPDLDDTLDALQAGFVPLERITNPMSFLAMFPGQMLTAYLLAAFIELTPLLLIIITLLGVQEPGDDRGPGLRAVDGPTVKIA